MFTLTRYTISVEAEQPGEPSARIRVDAGEGSYRIVEWSVTASTTGPAVTPAIVARILASFGPAGPGEATGPKSTADLGLSNATYGVLWRAGIKQVPQLTGLTRGQVLHLRGATLARVEEIETVLAAMDLSLAIGRRIADEPYVLARPQYRPSETPSVVYATTPKRMYRRRPADFLDVFNDLAGNPSAIAQHYGVPVHTVNAWRRAFRRLGPLSADPGSRQIDE
jgi:hypothetical protein